MSRSPSDAQFQIAVLSVGEFVRYNRITFSTNEQYSYHKNLSIIIEYNLLVADKKFFTMNDIAIFSKNYARLCNIFQHALNQYQI